MLFDKLASKEFVDENAGGSDWTYCGYKVNTDYRSGLGAPYIQARGTTILSAIIRGDYPGAELELLFPPLLSNNGTIIDLSNQPLNYRNRVGADSIKIFDTVKVLDNGQILMRWTKEPTSVTLFYMFLGNTFVGGSASSLYAQRDVEKVGTINDYIAGPYYFSVARYKLT